VVMCGTMERRREQAKSIVRRARPAPKLRDEIGNYLVLGVYITRPTRGGGTQSLFFSLKSNKTYF
jgi:hypothetical protein